LYHPLFRSFRKPKDWAAPVRHGRGAVAGGLLPAGFDPREITNLCLRNNRSVAPPSASAGGLHSAKAIR
jgi:hypothetical protein